MKIKDFNSYCRAEDITLSSLKKRLIKFEGVELRFYRVKGVLHCGIGHNCETKPLTENEHKTLIYSCIDAKIDLVLRLFEKDVEEVESQLRNLFPNFFKFRKSQQETLIEMVFQMGIGSFAGSKKLRKKGFKKTINYIKNGDWIKATIEACDSIWFYKNKKRAKKVLRGFLI